MPATSRIAEEILLKITGSEVQAFIRSGENQDERKLVLRHPAFFGLSSSLLAEQIAGRRKAKFKLPEFHNSTKIVYPPSINLEQSSSEQTALFKARLVADLGARTVADLTGGFGVDSYYISKVTDHVYYNEPNELIHSIAAFNLSQLGTSNITGHNQTAEDFLDVDSQEFDMIYIDPSRRSGSRKIFKLAECAPNVIALMPKLLAKSRYQLIKTSPLLDLQKGIHELSTVEKIFVVATEHECKEVLFLCSKKPVPDVVVECVNLDDTGDPRNLFSFTFSDEKEARSVLSAPLTYLYEPYPWVLKGGAFKLLSERFEVAKLHPNTHLYTSDLLRKDFPGRVFRLDGLGADRDIRKYFPENKANVLIRNYPLTPEELKKKLKLADGGDRYLIGFTGMRHKYLAAATRIH